MAAGEVQPKPPYWPGGDQPPRQFPGDTKRLEEDFTLVMVDGLAEFLDEIELDDEGIVCAALGN